MTQSRPRICASVVVLFVVLALLLHGTTTRAETDPCKKTTGVLEHCRYNQSGLCGFGNISHPVSCTHQLHQGKLTSDMTGAECQVERFEAASKYEFLQPARVYTREKPLVGLRVYLYRTTLTERAVVNFTFPSPDWSSLKFQYKVNRTRRILRRQFSLRGVSSPVSQTLVYDCVVFFKIGDVAKDAIVVLENDRGEGKTFIFQVPRHTRIDPWGTSLSEWHVFFYLHKDFIATSSHLPVTVQSAGHFGAVSYRVSIVKCLDANRPDCASYAALNYTVVANPKEDEWTVRLPIWSNPGSYAVTVQIVSDQCPPVAGCYVSVSPKFEIESSLLGIWISTGMVFFLIAFLTFLLVFNQRMRNNRNIMKSLQESQPSVLLVYLPEHQPYLEFINMFADFLKNTCHLLPYLVDRDVGIQDPNCWTQNYINKADRVLFVVPGNPDGESITPIRNQWIVAVNYLSGHPFIIQQASRKVAAVILPSSGSIPGKILHVCRFKLVDQIPALVTWLHGGTWMDEVFLWRPKIRSSSREKDSYTWSEIRDAAFRASSPTGRISDTHTCTSMKYGNILVTSNDDQTTALKEVSKHSEDSTTTDWNSESGSVFDSDIPSFDRLHGENGKKLSVSSRESDELLDSGDDGGIFT